MCITLPTSSYLFLLKVQLNKQENKHSVLKADEA